MVILGAEMIQSKTLQSSKQGFKGVNKNRILAALDYVECGRVLALTALGKKKLAHQAVGA
jgi:hypothetical protein